MICNECGAELENNSGTCPSCGAPVPPDSDVDETAVFEEGADPDGDVVAAVDDGADPDETTVIPDADATVVFDEGADPDETTVIPDSDSDATVVFDADADPDETSVLGNPDATAVRAPAPADLDETVVVAGASPSPEATSVLGNADATAVFGEAGPDDVLSDEPLEEEEEEPVEYVRYEGYATFMPIEPGDDSGIDVDPDELAGLEPIAVRDLAEDEIATTAIGPAYQIEDERPKSRRGLKIFLTVFIILLLAAGAACGIGYYKYKDRIAHEDVAVHVAMEVPGYPAGEESSSIPIRVAGMDLDGNTVDERMYIEDTKADIVLKRGEYQVSAAGTPVTGEGVIYRYPKRSVGIVIDETGVHAAGAGNDDADDSSAEEKPAESAESADSSASFMGEKVHLAYEQIAPERISDTMIDEAVAWMADSEADKPRMETLKAAITKARDDRLKQMEEEKKALERQRLKEELESALASNPAKVDSTKMDWTFTGTVVEYEFGTEIDGESRYFHQYALELPGEVAFDIVSKDDKKKLEEQKKAAEEPDDEAEDEPDEAEEEDSPDDADDEDEPTYVEPVKSSKVLILATLEASSPDGFASSPWADLLGKTVTVKGKLRQSITDDPENEYSQIHFADGVTAVKVFEEIEEDE